MNERITMHEVYMRFAETVALRSVCKRRVQVGCIITNAEMTNVVSIGYNGPARGLPHDCMPQTVAEPLTAAGTCTCIHAEINALLKAPYEGRHLVMFTTLSPCATCARLILNSNVRSVFFRSAYRLLDGIDILRRGGLLCRSMVDRV